MKWHTSEDHRLAFFRWHICFKTWFDFDMYIIWALRFSGIWCRVTGCWWPFRETLNAPKLRTPITNDAAQHIRRTHSSTASLRTLKNSQARNFSSHGTTTSFGFGTGMFYFIPPHPLSCYAPPPKQYLFTFALYLHRNPSTLVTVIGVRMIHKFNKRQPDFKQINCNSFCMQISRPKQYPVIAQSD